MSSDAVDDLREEYLRLTREALPRTARADGWHLTEDHCFQRVLLDRVSGGVWYDHIARPAWRNASEAQLERLVADAHRLLEEGEALLTAWDADSLRWRRAR